MGANKDQSSEPKNMADYETAVMDFLDKQMAADQPNKKQNESGQEVDALVTDLLKQVITESDHPNGESQIASDSQEAALSDIPPLEASHIKKGEEEAARIKAKHDIISKFLNDILGIYKKEAEKDACKIENSNYLFISM